MKYIYDLHRTMLKQQLLLVYEGEFSQEITKSVLAMAERNMDSFGEESKIKKKVFNVMVEALQNIDKHSSEFNQEKYGKKNAIFLLSKRDDAYVITTGNPVEVAHVENITSRIDKLNAMDEAQIKQERRERMKKLKNAEEDLSDVGGAGLGFIDMRKRTGNPLIYDMEVINDELKFFSLKVTVTIPTMK
ncbi:MAG: SiaB family protein kinase [Bacteroidota bacterium]